MQSAPVKPMLLETVWSTLSENRWVSTNQLRAASGADERTLMCIVDFLVRWNFAEVRSFPSIQVRRKPGAISPIQTVSLLRAMNKTIQPTTIALKGKGRLAERVACRVCGARSLRATGVNEVECTRCHERQWYTIDGAGFNNISFARTTSKLKKLVSCLNFLRPSF
jgi:hypothetical protein